MEKQALALAVGSGRTSLTVEDFKKLKECMSRDRVITPHYNHHVLEEELITIAPVIKIENNPKWFKRTKFEEEKDKNYSWIYKQYKHNHDGLHGFRADRQRREHGTLHKLEN